MRRIPKTTLARINELQGHAQELADLLVGLAQDAETYSAERSDNWHDSDAGSDYSDWAEALYEAAETSQDAADHVGSLSPAPGDD